MKAIQTIEISPGQSLVTIDLQANKWNRADSITLFVEDNHGSDVSELHSVKVWGSPVMGTDVAAIHNQPK